MTAPAPWHALLAPDGSFTGTCWLMTGPAPHDDEPPQWDRTHRPPTVAEVAPLLQLVTDILARSP